MNLQTNNDKAKVTTLKAELFDLIAEQQQLTNQFNQLEQRKREKLTELDTAVADCRAKNGEDCCKGGACGKAGS